VFWQEPIGGGVPDTLPCRCRLQATHSTEQAFQALPAGQVGTSHDPISARHEHCNKARATTCCGRDFPPRCTNESRLWGMCTMLAGLTKHPPSSPLHPLAWDPARPAQPDHPLANSTSMQSPPDGQSTVATALNTTTRTPLRNPQPAVRDGSLKGTSPHNATTERAPPAASKHTPNTRTRTCGTTPQFGSQRTPPILQTRSSNATGRQGSLSTSSTGIRSCLAVPPD
jgi:hypothetical protein